MANNKPLLSICIPTYNRAEYLDKCIASIVSQKEFGSEDVELVISDNASTDNTEEIVKKYQERYKNIFYSKNSESTNPGDENFPIVIGKAHGIFRKLSNDTLIYADKSLEYILDIVRKSADEKHVLFFMNNVDKKICKKIYKTDSFDLFVKTTSFWTTSMATFGIWEDDFEKLEDKFEGCSLHLWQSKVLFEIVARKKTVFICNKHIFSGQEVQKKDLSYGLHKIFYENYLGLYEKYLATGILSKNTFAYLKKHLLFDFFHLWMLTFHFHSDNFKISEEENLERLVLNSYRHEPYYIRFYLKFKKDILKRRIKDAVKKYLLRRANISYLSI